MLANERLRRGSGLDRAGDRKTVNMPSNGVPDGAVVVDGGKTRLVIGSRLLTFTFAGWSDPLPRPNNGSLEVLTPGTSLLALSNGYRPLLHPSALTP